MADAESLARQLTAVEAWLRVRSAGGDAPRATLATPEITALPTDGPAEIEAKADILADQSRRLENEAIDLTRRAASIRSRHELRRRAGQMDRDPFAGLGGPKRRTFATAGDGRSGESGGRGPAGAGAPPPPGGASPPPAPGSGSGGGDSGFTALPQRVRDALDPATLAEMRRLEVAGGAAADAQALEHAARALRDKAQRLDARAKAMRQLVPAR